MDKEILDFVNGDVSVLHADVIIGKEKTEKGNEYITITLPDGDQLYGFWHNPKKKVSDKQPKHIGGKKPYVMVMLDRLREIKASNDVIGYAVRLSDNIQWNTGLLIDKRKKTALTYDDLRKIYGCSNGTFVKKLKEMKDAGILLKDKEGYKISTQFIKKGGAKHE